MIDVVLFGARGRMGRLVAETYTASPRIHIIAGVERPAHPDVGRTIDGLLLFGSADSLPSADVWLDFSLASPSVEHALAAAELGMPLVVAATGFSNEQVEQLKQAAEHCALLLAPNLSLGVAAMDRLAALASKLLKGKFDAAIVETHHSTKRDTPSGTAKRLVETIAATSRIQPMVLSIRAGGVIGEHEIRFAGAEEELIIVHRAWSRRAFASGVERALEFVVNQAPGFYTLDDLYEDA